MATVAAMLAWLNRWTACQWYYDEQAAVFRCEHGYAWPRQKLEAVYREKVDRR